MGISSTSGVVPGMAYPDLLARHKQMEEKSTYSAKIAPAWCSPCGVPVLSRNEVHVWRASLVLNASRLHSLQQSLSMEERERAERFHFREGQEYFIAARGTLRAILGRYLDMEPDRIRFCYGSQGKPALAEASGEDKIRFNVSHSHGIAVIAVALEREVGVDLEAIRDDVAIEQIAERFFSAGEIAAFHALPAHVRREAFFACWTRKEAYMKARGEGFGIRLDEFDVSLAPGEPVALLSVRDKPDEPGRWSLRELKPEPGFAAALAVEGHDCQLKCWQWQ